MLAKRDGEGLKQHTQNLLLVLEELRRAIPSLGDEKFWQKLYMVAVFHDLGKATPGFQQMMRDGTPYRFRHEILSAIVAMHYEDKDVATAVLSHHKSLEKIRELLREYENNERDNEGRWPQKEWEALDKEWIRNFLMDQKIEAKELEFKDVKELLRPWVSKRQRKEISPKKRIDNIFLFGALTICDHNASAGVLEVPVLESRNFSSLDQINPYDHQRRAWNTEKNVLLTAPTGSGKTESALGWLRSQLGRRQARAFYVLPYTASINAMVDRLLGEQKGVGDEKYVGLLHGKARFFLYEKYSQKGEGASIKELADLNRKVFKPLKVVTPFQLLKWAFGVKGFERGFVELAGSYLIFDELHVYDPELYRRIIFFLEWLVKRLDVKVFIMSATIPTFVRDHIRDVLGDMEMISPSVALLKEMRRHRVKLLEGGIEDHLKLVYSWLDAGKKVLVVCNTVSKAQEIYQKLDWDSKVLLHSAFNGEDRMQKEMEIFNGAQLIVGTQAIEVSLDIDYDVILTEPAPLDALLQRFGRVYRNRRIDNGDQHNCYVTTQIEKSHTFIYDGQILEKTIDVLKKVDGEILQEDMIQEMLDNVYVPIDLDPDGLRETFWEHLERLYPYLEYKENEEEFYTQFDGVEVLPKELLGDFVERIKNDAYIEAEQLLVSISKRKFVYYKNEGLIDYIDGFKKLIPVIALRYDHDVGLLNDPLPNLEFGL